MKAETASITIRMSQKKKLESIKKQIENRTGRCATFADALNAVLR